MIFTDSHCHLTMSNAEENLAAARAAGVRGFVVPGTKLEDAPQAVRIAQQHDDVWAAVGFHPHDAKDCDDAAFAEISRLAREPRVVAIGECGLDYHYMHSTRETQIAVFERHIELAKELDKPIIVHNRQSTDDMVLIETDTPYLAPVPFRGRDNEPAYVIKIAELLARLWDVPLERVAEATTANFERVFSVTVPRGSS